jgi:hypothetical protein
MASASVGSSGTRTTSHSSRTPLATASTGSRLRERSSQATSAPAAWASATARRASVVAPDEPVPRRATLPGRGNPPVARSASRSAKPVGTIRPISSWTGGRTAGEVAGRATIPGRAAGDGNGSEAEPPPDRGTPPGSPGSCGISGTGAMASAPKTSVAGRGAASPQRSRSVARAAARRSIGSIGFQTIEHVF